VANEVLSLGTEEWEKVCEEYRAQFESMSGRRWKHESDVYDDYLLKRLALWVQQGAKKPAPSCFC